MQANSTIQNSLNFHRNLRPSLIVAKDLLKADKNRMLMNKWIIISIETGFKNFSIPTFCTKESKSNYDQGNKRM